MSRRERNGTAEADRTAQEAREAHWEVGGRGDFAVLDYVEKSGGKTLMAGHGVIGWDVKLKCCALHWFDTFGSPPSVPGKGQWRGDTLKFEQEGSANTIFELADGGLTFKIEMNVDGKGWKPIIAGKYQRAGSAAKFRKRISLNWIV